MEESRIKKASYPSADIIARHLRNYADWGGEAHLSKTEPGIIDRIANVFALEECARVGAKTLLIRVLSDADYFKAASWKEYESYLRHLQMAMLDCPETVRTANHLYEPVL